MDMTKYLGLYFKHLTMDLSLQIFIQCGLWSVSYPVCTEWPKKLSPFLYPLTLPNINRFSKLFRCQNLEKICSNTITKDPTTPEVCRYTTL